MSDEKKKLAEAIATADEMAATFRGQIERQKDGMTRLIKERELVIQTLQEGQAADDLEVAVRRVLEIMHVKPKH